LDMGLAIILYLKFSELLDTVSEIHERLTSSMIF
jgi:hypothetical protein